MSRRKDLDRFLCRKAENPDYTGFRGVDSVTVKPQAVLESVTCSVCQRKRNVAEDTLPADRQTYVCQRCQDDPGGDTPG